MPSPAKLLELAELHRRLDLVVKHFVKPENRDKPGANVYPAEMVNAALNLFLGDSSLRPPATPMLNPHYYDPRMHDNHIYQRGRGRFLKRKAYHSDASLLQQLQAEAGQIQLSWSDYKGISESDSIFLFQHYFPDFFVNPFTAQAQDYNKDILVFPVVQFRGRIGAGSEQFLYPLYLKMMLAAKAAANQPGFPPPYTIFFPTSGGKHEVGFVIEINSKGEYKVTLTNAMSRKYRYHEQYQMVYPLIAAQLNEYGLRPAENATTYHIAAQVQEVEGPCGLVTAEILAGGIKHLEKPGVKKDDFIDWNAVTNYIPRSSRAGEAAEVAFWNDRMLLYIRGVSTGQEQSVRDQLRKGNLGGPASVAAVAPPRAAGARAAVGAKPAVIVKNFSAAYDQVKHVYVLNAAMNDETLQGMINLLQNFATAEPPLTPAVIARVNAVQKFDMHLLNNGTGYDVRIAIKPGVSLTEGDKQEFLSLIENITAFLESQGYTYQNDPALQARLAAQQTPAAVVDPKAYATVVPPSFAKGKVTDPRYATVVPPNFQRAAPTPAQAQAQQPNNGVFDIIAEANGLNIVVLTAQVEAIRNLRNLISGWILQHLSDGSHDLTDKQAAILCAQQIQVATNDRGFTINFGDASLTDNVFVLQKIATLQTFIAEQLRQHYGLRNSQTEYEAPDPDTVERLMEMFAGLQAAGLGAPAQLRLDPRIQPSLRGKGPGPLR